jgi:hypothetical protein|tara:strand:+ start:435 stop:809 length:375 start_codon:yes stop_codon:yes gene_type:complete
MKRNISLLITLFIASTLLFAAKPLVKETESLDKAKKVQLNKVKPIKKNPSTSGNIVKPMKKKPRKPSEVQSELQLLRKKFESERLSIHDEFKNDLKMLKKRKKQAIDELRAKYKKKRAFLKNNN